MRNINTGWLWLWLGLGVAAASGCRAEQEQTAAAGDATAQIPASTSSGGAGTAATCKRGMAVANEVTPQFSIADLEAIRGKVHWWYNWSLAPLSVDMAQASVARKIDFVPLVFSRPSDSNALALHADSAGGFLLGFNEPNFTSQGNLTPEAAAAAWPMLEQFADAHQLKLVSPAMNYCGGGCNITDPFAWLDAFLAACKNCRIDAIAIHAYVCDAGALKSAYLDPFAQRYGKPLWVTEMACLDGSKNANDPNVQLAYMTEAVAMLEADPRVERYAWFLARSSDRASTIALLDGAGNLTPLGTHYLALPAACDAAQ